VVNTLSEVRAQVKELLEATGLRTYDYAKEKAVPPYAVVVPNDPYLVPSETFGQYTIRFVVFVAGPRGTSNQQAEDTEEMVVKAINAFKDQTDVYVVQVSSPLPRELTQLNLTVFGSEIEIEAEIIINEGEG